MKQPIYLDYNATTPVDPAVFDAMKPYFEDRFGNPSSRSHSYGWQASMAVEKARKQVADLVGADPKEIVWTSGATESNNMAILGLVRAFRGEPVHVITTTTEHKAVLEVCALAEELGAEVTYLPVDKHGQVSAEQVEKALQPHTKLISVIMANNEIGTLNPIAAIGDVAKRHKVYFHTDVAQAAGKVPINVQGMNIDMLSISGHKIYGPKGVGALYVRGKDPAVPLEPIIRGGSQENGLRPGTLNVPGIVGLGKAIEMAQANMNAESQRLCALRDRIIQTISHELPEAHLNGHPTERLCNNVSFSFDNLSADVFALGLSGLALSSGSACTSANAAPSHVLKALGHSDELANATLRIGLGRFTQDDDVDQAIAKVIAMVQKNRAISIA